ncbi:hypothetical protein WISP_82419 [Willisornis vidua]|uniref:Uncharacterized protein n=1 Tax=Willisornis vidua TaxID=1566151 RepID=A0ABQ9D709_9PASS|nr:hypothetical protein WISP_82419 [Willisornis vidua]
MAEAPKAKLSMDANTISLQQQDSIWTRSSPQSFPETVAMPKSPVIPFSMTTLDCVKDQTEPELEPGPEFAAVCVITVTEPECKLPKLLLRTGQENSTNSNRKSKCPLQTCTRYEAIQHKEKNQMLDNGDYIMLWINLDSFIPSFSETSAAPNGTSTALDKTSAAQDRTSAVPDELLGSRSHFALMNPTHFMGFRSHHTTLMHLYWYRRRSSGGPGQNVMLAKIPCLSEMPALQQETEIDTKYVQIEKVTLTTVLVFIWVD